MVHYPVDQWDATIYNFIRDFIARRRYSPTFREIQQGIKAKPTADNPTPPEKSTDFISRRVDGLVKLGLLDRPDKLGEGRGVARAITIRKDVVLIPDR